MSTKIFLDGLELDLILTNLRVTKIIFRLVST